MADVGELQPGWKGIGSKKWKSNERMKRERGKRKEERGKRKEKREKRKEKRGKRGKRKE